LKTIALLKLIEEDYSYQLLIEASDMTSHKINEAALEALKFKNNQQKSA
jgi:AAA family ATP:ADP antiporter